MKKRNKIHWVLFSLLIYSNTCFSQINIDNLNKINIGVDVFTSRNTIKNLFTTKGSLYKYESFSGVYSLDFEKSIFNKCENADFSFFYVYDTLSEMRVKLSYLFNEKTNETRGFMQSLEKLLADINQGNNKIKYQNKFSNLNLRKIESLINKIDSIHKSKFEKDNFGIYSGSNVCFCDFIPNDRRVLIFDVNIWHGIHSWSGEKPPASISLQINISLTTPEFMGYRSKYGVYGTASYVYDQKSIDLSFKNGVYSLPVRLNNVLNLDFILDLGASDVSISPDVFLVLYKSGTIKDSDFIGEEKYQFADGSTSKSSVFNLSKLLIGDIELNNVRASISNNINSPLLLGQSALKKLPSYKIDNQNNKLIVE